MEEKTIEDIILISNGPGEITSWVAPVARALKRHLPYCYISLYLVPCQFSSGDERSIASQISEIDRVYSAKEFTRFFFKRSPKKNAGIVISLGGETWYALFLALKFRYPAYAYVERTILPFGFKKIFLAHRDGNLMADLPRSTHPLLEEMIHKKTIAFYPGSRKRFCEVLIPFFSKAGTLLEQKGYRVKWYVPHSLLPYIYEHYPDIVPHLIADERETALMITIVGTNNMVLAAKGVPHIALLPLNWPHLIPMTGVWGLLSELPFIGVLFKKLVIAIMKPRMQYVSLPNIIARDSIVPEITKRIRYEDIVTEVENIYTKDKLQALSDRLVTVVGQAGVATRMVQDIMKREGIE